jgi:hypothetical protein
MDEPRPVGEADDPVAEEVRLRRAAALELHAAVQRRLGRGLTAAEWAALNPAGRYSAAEASPVEAEMLVLLCSRVTGPVRGRGSRGWELGLPQTAGRLELRRGARSQWKWWVRLMGPPLGAGIYLSSAGIAPLVVAGWAVPLLVAGWFGAGLIQRERLRILRLVEDELPRSDILERLGANDAELATIEFHMPPPYSWHLRNIGSRQLRDRVQLVAAHLDWFLEPPRPYFRWRWLMDASNLLRLVLVLAFFIMQIYSRQSNTLLYLLGLLVVVTSYRVQPALVDLERYFADALAALLQQRIRIRCGEAEAGADADRPLLQSENSNQLVT